MTRKTKIGLAVAVAILVVVAAGFWLGEEQGEVRVTFAGVNTYGSNSVLFTVTNGSKTNLIMDLHVQEHSFVGWRRTDERTFSSGMMLKAGRAMVYGINVPSTNYWRTEIRYLKYRTPSFVGAIRTDLATYAEKRGWISLSRRLYPKSGFGSAHGPIMLGNKPAPPEPK